MATLMKMESNNLAPCYVRVQPKFQVLQSVGSFSLHWAIYFIIPKQLPGVVL